MSRATRATRMLEEAGVAFTLHATTTTPRADRIGIQAAEALGEPPERVLKTLMALVDGKPACVIAASNREVSMKKVAAAFGGKSAEMMKPADAERRVRLQGRRDQPVRTDAKAADRDRGAVDGARLRFHQWRPARIAGAAEPARSGDPPEGDRCSPLAA